MVNIAVFAIAFSQSVSQSTVHSFIYSVSQAFIHSVSQSVIYSVSQSFLQPSMHSELELSRVLCQEATRNEVGAEDRRCQRAPVVPRDAGGKRG